jgi:nucleotide-binding universal stress UspA family protein
MKNILVAIDFSEVSERLLEQAFRLAEAFGAALRIVHVAAPDPAFVSFEAGPQSVRDKRAEELRKEHRALQYMGERARERGIEAKTLLLQGPTVESLLDQADKVRADLILAGCHGHGKLYKTLVGSVSEGILRNPPCPVLLVPAL